MIVLVEVPLPVTVFVVTLAELPSALMPTVEPGGTVKLLVPLLTDTEPPVFPVVPAALKLTVAPVVPGARLTVFPALATVSVLSEELYPMLEPGGMVFVTPLVVTVEVPLLLAVTLEPDGTYT